MEPVILTDELPAVDDVEIPVGDFESITVTRAEFEGIKNRIWRDARITFRDRITKITKEKRDLEAHVAELARTVISLANRFSGASSPLDQPTATTGDK